LPRGALLGVLLLVLSPATEAVAADRDNTPAGTARAHIDVYDHLVDDLLERTRVEFLVVVHGLLGHLDERATAPVRHASGFDLLEPLEGRIGSRFGPRLHPILGFVRMHQGVDIGASVGTPVRAGGPGKVLRAGDAGAYGTLVTIDHGDSSETRYAHLSKSLVEPGETVLRGQIIGEVGNTGLSTGPHLHFELRVDGIPVDPAPWLPLLRGR
jgi:murein DD-endopeptidase MepM/ murein hydrolase activator NlpD